MGAATQGQLGRTRRRTLGSFGTRVLDAYGCNSSFRRAGSEDAEGRTYDSVNSTADEADRYWPLPFSVPPFHSLDPILPSQHLYITNRSACFPDTICDYHAQAPKAESGCTKVHRASTQPCQSPSFPERRIRVGGFVSR